MNQEVISLLKSNTEEMVSYISSIDSSIVNIKPTPEQWSIIEVCDHLISTDFGIYSLLNTEGEPAPTDRPSKIEQIAVVGNDRTVKVKAPATLVPKGKTDSQEKFDQKLNSLRSKMIAIAEQKDLTQVCSAFPHFVLGHMTFEEWLHFTINHVNRHKDQIREIVEAVNPT